jgi:probable F420-dependent oxidoreductase
MKLGLNLPTLLDSLASGDLLQLCRSAEDAGYHQVWVGEHVVLSDNEPNDYFPSTAPMPDPLVLLTAVAATTTTIRLGTGVCLPTQRNPVYLAKEVSTLDWLSSGRVDLGMGLGWSLAELEAVGASPAGRAARFRDYVSVMKHLWNDENREAEWPTYRLPAVRQFPRPTQPGGPPLWIGGNSDAALRRAAQIGDGWFGFADIGDDAAEQVATLQEEAAAAGRGPVRVALLTYRKLDHEELSAYEHIGVEQVALSLSGTSLPELQDQLVEAASHFASFQPA